MLRSEEFVHIACISWHEHLIICWHVDWTTTLLQYPEQYFNHQSFNHSNNPRSCVWLCRLLDSYSMHCARRLFRSAGFPALHPSLPKRAMGRLISFFGAGHILARRSTVRGRTIIILINREYGNCLTVIVETIKCLYDLHCKADIRSIKHWKRGLNAWRRINAPITAREVAVKNVDILIPIADLHIPSSVYSNILQYKARDPWKGKS